MNHWLFILGRQAELSAAEIVSVLKRGKIQYSPTRLGKNELIIATEDDLGDPQTLLNGLGGTIKIVKLDDQAPLKDPTKFKDVFQELLKTDLLVKLYGNETKKKGRWTFGLSIYAPGIPKKHHKNLSRVVHGIGLKIKTDLKSQNVSSRFVSARGKDLSLSSVVVRKNKLNKENGSDIVLMAAGNSVWRGQTVAVQDFEAYGHRDFGRPARNPRAGSLPPKLAQIMLNLAQVKSGERIHDPFMGQATLLQEGAILGYVMTGSDSDIKQVRAAERNLKWLVKENIIKSAPKVWSAQAQKIVMDEKVDAIVTEGLLGAPHNRPLTPSQAQTQINRLNQLWLKTLQRAAGYLKDGGKIVCTWPALVKTDKSVEFLPIIDQLEDLGYRLETILPDSYKFTGVNQEHSVVTKRGTLIYARPGQVVQREIVRLTKDN